MHQLTDREVLEFFAGSNKMGERYMRVLLTMCHGPIGICELYVQMNPELCGGQCEEGDSEPMDEAELRRILKGLVRNEWVARKGHEYTIRDSVSNLLAEIKPQLQQELDAFSQREEKERAVLDAERDKRSRENRAKRKYEKIALWKLLWERQSGKCCMCENELPPAPIFRERNYHGTVYQEQEPPFIRKIREVGPVLPCERCFDRLHLVKTQDQFVEAKNYWNIVDAAQQENPSLISRRELIRSGVSPKELEVLSAQGLLHTQLVAGDVFYDRNDFTVVDAAPDTPGPLHCEGQHA